MWSLAGTAKMSGAIGSSIAAIHLRVLFDGLGKQEQRARLEHIGVHLNMAERPKNAEANDNSTSTFRLSKNHHAINQPPPTPKLSLARVSATTLARRTMRWMLLVTVTTTTGCARAFSISVCVQMGPGAAKQKCMLTSVSATSMADMPKEKGRTTSAFLER